ncbi:MAG: DUF262 domain-containing protein [Treponema sp.]|nr:DUF262 domain-containing protein [Treponema sp.]
MEKRKIEQIFNGSSMLEIPYFQRSYVWDEENWKRFLEDFREICIAKKEYFMGTYIMKQKPTPSGTRYGDVRAVIDGQQRFTTLILFFLVLANKNNKYEKDFESIFINRQNEIILSHNHSDKPIFDLLTKNQELTDSQKEEYKNNNVYQAYLYFQKNIKPEDFDIDTLLRCVYFIPIDLESNDDEQQIFDTINSLGVRLTTAELLKNTLYSNNEIELFKETWEKCFEKDQGEKDFWDTIVGSREKHSNLDTFLYAYINIYDDKDIRYKSLFNSYKNYLGSTLNNSTMKEGFIKDLISYAEIYRKYIRPDIQSVVLSDFKNSINRLNIVFFGLDTTTLLPYCLYVLKNAKPEEADKIFGYLGTYIIRRMLCHDWTKNYNKKFKTMLTNKIVTFDALYKNIMDSANNEDRLPTDLDLQKLINYDHTNAQTRGILYLLETGLRQPGKESTSVLPLDSYDLEHIMPKDWKQYWALEPSLDTPDNRDNRIYHIGLIGNKTLLAKGLNKSIKNREYSTKKNGVADNFGYNHYAVGLKTFDFESYKNWNEDTIEERQSKLLEQIKIVWPYGNVR